jgi:hypothetical protein
MVFILTYTHISMRMLPFQQISRAWSMQHIARTIPSWRGFLKRFRFENIRLNSFGKLDAFSERTLGEKIIAFRINRHPPHYSETESESPSPTRVRACFQYFRISGAKCNVPTLPLDGTQRAMLLRVAPGLGTRPCDHGGRRHHQWRPAQDSDCSLRPLHSSLLQSGTASRFVHGIPTSSWP